MSEHDELAETRPVHTMTLEIVPQVRRFVTAIREQLADLDDEEREELLGGLEADLTERLAESGAGLGDPVAYAAELRAAAGLVSERRPGLRHRFGTLVVEARGEWDRRLADHAALGRAKDLVLAMQPAWWVLRAWIAVQLIDLMNGPTEYLTVLPSLGSQLIGFLVLLVAVVASVLVGSGAALPRGGRWVVVGLNAFAVVALFIVLARFPSPWDSHVYADGRYDSYSRDVTPEAGLVADGRPVRNVYAYDAQGKPLFGVQLFDQQGRPLEVDTGRRLRVGDEFGLTYRWVRAGRAVSNVFPLPVRQQPGYRHHDDAWTSEDPPSLPVAPVAVVPPATLPTPPAASTAPSAQPSAQPSAKPRPDKKP